MASEEDKAHPLARLVRRREIDLVILADCRLGEVSIIDALQRQGLSFASLEPSHPRLKFLQRSTHIEIEPVVADDRFSLVRLVAKGHEDVLIGALHLDDRQNTPKPGSRLSKARGHITTLTQAETMVGHDRTIVLGDFNMTPEEEGLVDPSSFGALMTWELAHAQSLSEPNGPSRFFNPMWSLMGRAQAPGTYYWDSGDPHNIYWYCLDAVIARHSLRGVFREETLEIVTTIPDQQDQDTPLVRFARKHWKIDYSDHLPICFELHLRPQ